MAYEINININGEVSDSGVDRNTVQSSNESTQKQTEQVKSQKNLAKFISAQTIEPFLQNVKTQITQNIAIATGNTELQQRVNFGFELAQFGTQTYRNAQGGALVFKALGLSGGLGMGIGIGLTAINTGMQIAFNQSQINLQKSVENYQLQQIRDRQGVAYNKSRR